MTTRLLLPELPGGMVRVLRWLRHEGEQLQAGEPLLLVLAEGAELLLPAPEVGVLQAILAPEGTQVTAQQAYALLVERAAEPARRLRVSPVARRVAADLGVDLTTISGTGAHGLILKRDVLSARQELDRLRVPEPAIPASLAQPPEVSAAPITAPASSAAAQAVEPPAVRVAAPDAAAARAEFERLADGAGALAVPHGLLGLRSALPYALTALEVDCSALDLLAERHAVALATRGLQLDLLAAVTYAVASCLPQHPFVNAHWSDEGVLLRRRVHLWVEAAGHAGLLHDAADLNLRGIMRALRERQPRDGDATFVIAGSQAWWGGLALPANLPAAVLGVGQVERRPVVIETAAGDRLQIRAQALLTLAHDLRVLEYDQATAFLLSVRRMLTGLAAMTAI